MALFRVVVVRTLYVMAENEHIAERVAARAERNIAEETVRVQTATLDGARRDNWHDCEPYGVKFGSDSGLTVAELLEAGL